MTDLVERLRAWAAVRVQDNDEDLVVMAADEIERLRAEVSDDDTLLAEAADKIERLHAEIARLRKEIEALVGLLQ